LGFVGVLLYSSGSLKLGREYLLCSFCMENPLVFGKFKEKDEIG
jgi:hypothetical protein